MMQQWALSCRAIDPEDYVRACSFSVNPIANIDETLWMYAAHRKFMFPIAFPNSCYSAMVHPYDYIKSELSASAIGTTTTSEVNTYIGVIAAAAYAGTMTANASIIAIGY